MVNRDTVASMGLVLERFIPLVNTRIRVFRQALSLDEVRDQHHMISAQLSGLECTLFPS